jgi:RNA polymerase sigma-70 factor (ECF subfamily)
MGELSDERLVELTLGGHDEAFASLVGRHKRRVFAIVNPLAGNQEDAKDICQEVFLKTYRTLKSFRKEAPFAHWLAKIAVHACYDFLRKKRQEIPHDPLEDGITPFKDTSAWEEIDARAARDLINSALSRIDAADRLVITLLGLEGRTVKEVSELTGWSESKVKVRAFRARRKIKEMLGADDGEQ